MEGGFLPVLGFAVAASVTPGPNNVMVATAAANHGIAATLPQMLGIALGFAAMFVLVGFGLALPLATHPGADLLLRWVAVAWLLWLAVQIARAPPPGTDQAGGRPPLGFIGAALFQWINPKAWLLAIGGTATYVAPDLPVLPQVTLIALIFAGVVIPCALLWATIGRGAGRMLRRPDRLRAFNLTMAALLVASVLPVLWGK